MDSAHLWNRNTCILLTYFLLIVFSVCILVTLSTALCFHLIIAGSVVFNCWSNYLCSFLFFSSVHWQMLIALTPWQNRVKWLWAITLKFAFAYNSTRSTPASAFNAIAKRRYAAFNNCAYAPLHFKEAAFQVEDNFTQHHRTLDTATATATTIAIHNKTESAICCYILCVCVHACELHTYNNYAVSVLSIAFCSHFSCSAVATWGEGEVGSWRRQAGGRRCAVNMPSSCSDFVSK